jgi:DNA-binding NtrC family response regulator
MKIIPPIMLIGGISILILRNKMINVGGFRKALALDDDIRILKLLEALLAKIGYRALTVTTRESALELLKKEQVDFVLLDICLPGDSGLDILKEIKQVYPHLPVIMLTTLGYDDKALKEALSRGASGYVSKTCSFQELKAVISRALKSSK